MTINEGRRCALPGCYVIIEPELDGRPQRKYCTAAHRAVARQMRRESAHRSASAPPLPFSSTSEADLLPLPPRATAPAVISRRREFAIAAMRRCRAVAVLGSAGLLVTGGGLMAASAPSTDPTTISASRVQGADADAEKRWLKQATVTLASVQKQLTEVEKAEQAWHALPEDRRFEPKPIPVRNLESRRLQLTQQKVALQTQIKTYGELDKASKSVADLDDTLENLDNALKASSSRRKTDPESGGAGPRKQLVDQREQVARRRAAQKTELDSLRGDVHKAMSTPLTEDDSPTKSITTQVQDLIAHPERDNQSREPNQSGTQVHRPEVTGPREQDDPETDQVGNGAPPVPGHGRPEIPTTPDGLAVPAQPTVPVPSVPRPALPTPENLTPGDLTPGAGPSVGHNDVLANGVNPGVPGSVIPGPTGDTQQDTVKLPAVGAPPLGTPGAQRPGVQQPGPRQHGSLGGLLADGTTQNPVDPPTQPLPTQPQPSRPGVTLPGVGQPGQAVNATPGGSGWNEHSATGATQPINTVPGAGHTDSASTGSRNDVLGGVSRPVERVADSTSDSGGSREGATSTPDTGAGGWSESPTSHLPRTSNNTGTDRSNTGSDSTYTGLEKADDASRIAESAMSGDMDDVFSGAMAAGRHAEESKSGSSSSSGSSHRDSDSGDADDIRDSILESYGVDSGDSGSSRSHGSRSHSSPDDDYSGYDSSDIDSVIDHYSGGNSSGSSSRHSNSDDDSNDSDDFSSYADWDSDSDSGSNHSRSSRDSDSDDDSDHHSSRSSSHDSDYSSYYDSDDGDGDDGDGGSRSSSRHSSSSHDDDDD